MSAPTREQIARWWRTLTEHQQRYGKCPICGTRSRCWLRADAFGQLVAYDLFFLGAFDSTPVDASGGNPTVGEVEGADRETTQGCVVQVQQVRAELR